MAEKKTKAPARANTDAAKVVAVNSPSGLNLRKAPAYTAPIVTVLPHGARLTLLTADAAEGWMSVDTDFGAGYVAADFVEEA